MRGLGKPAFRLIRCEKEITRNQLKARLRPCHNLEEVLNELVAISLEDINPLYESDELEKEPASNEYKTKLEIRDYYNHGVTYFYIDVKNILECYEVDEDGDFLEGSDFDTNLTAAGNEEKLDYLLAELNIEL